MSEIDDLPEKIWLAELSIGDDNIETGTVYVEESPDFVEYIRADCAAAMPPELVERVRGWLHVYEWDDNTDGDVELFRDILAWAEGK